MQDTSSKQQTKQKYKPNHQQTGLPPHSALPIGGKANKQQQQQKPNQKNPAQISPCMKLTNHWTNLWRAETKRKKEFNLLQGKNSIFLEAWGKETSNTISLKKL